MEAIKLENHQIIFNKGIRCPKIEGYNSLYFHPLTKGNDKSLLAKWGMELTKICKKDNIQFYYLINQFGLKVHVYPNATIEEWFTNRKQESN